MALKTGGSTKVTKRMAGGLRNYLGRAGRYLLPFGAVFAFFAILVGSLSLTMQHYEVPDADGETAKMEVPEKSWMQVGQSVVGKATQTVAGALYARKKYKPYNPNSMRHEDWWLGYDVRDKSPPNKPSSTVYEPDFEAKKERERMGVEYEGNLDPKHVGGNLENDTASYEPNLWTWFQGPKEAHYVRSTEAQLNASSVLDIGCGRGVSTKYFVDMGLERVLCVEGSHEAVLNSNAPQNTIEHDYTIGPYWPEGIFDVAWTCEFLEHIDPLIVENYMATLAKARIVFATHSFWGGWHHVAVKDKWWWIELFRDYGFEFMPSLTEIARKKAIGQYFKHSGLVFRNLRYPLRRQFGNSKYYYD